MAQRFSIIGSLKKLFVGLGKSKTRITPEPSEHIAPLEPISRFITNKRWVTLSNGNVKKAAFIPNSNSQTSVYRMAGVEQEMIWHIGEDFVIKPMEAKGILKKLWGIAVIVAKDISDNGLLISPKPTPHPRHADITNWPKDRSERKMKAAELANEAKFIENSNNN